MHKYRCASCGHIFTSENFAEKCPECGSRILIHKEGEPRKTAPAAARAAIVPPVQVNADDNCAQRTPDPWNRDKL